MLIFDNSFFAGSEAGFMEVNRNARELDRERENIYADPDEIPGQFSCETSKKMTLKGQTLSYAYQTCRHVCRNLNRRSGVLFL